MWPDPHPLFTPRSSVFGLIQAVHSSLTLPTSHSKYNEWLYKVEIGIHCLKWSPQPVFESWVGTNVAWSTLLFTPRSSVLGMIQAIDSILTLPMSYHKYNEWLHKVEIGIHCLKWSPQPVFESWVTTYMWIDPHPLFTPSTKIECVQTDSSISQQIDPSNISLYTLSYEVC